MRFTLLFCQTSPSYFWIGISNRRNLFGIEIGFLTSSNFCSNVTFMNSFMSEHRLTNNVTNCKNIIYISAHLIVDWDKTALIHNDAGN